MWEGRDIIQFQYGSGFDDIHVGAKGLGEKCSIISKICADQFFYLSF